MYTRPNKIGLEVPHELGIGRPSLHVLTSSASAAETGATKDDIDDLFGWLQAERAKDQQKAYAGIAEHSVRARCTTMI